MLLWTYLSQPFVMSIQPTISGYVAHLNSMEWSIWLSLTLFRWTSLGCRFREPNSANWQSSRKLCVVIRVHPRLRQRLWLEDLAGGILKNNQLPRATRIKPVCFSSSRVFSIYELPPLRCLIRAKSRFDVPSHFPVFTSGIDTYGFGFWKEFQSRILAVHVLCVTVFPATVIFSSSFCLHFTISQGDTLLRDFVVEFWLCTFFQVSEKEDFRLAVDVPIGCHTDSRVPTDTEGSVQQLPRAPRRGDLGTNEPHEDVLCRLDAGMSISFRFTRWTSHYG